MTKVREIATDCLIQILEEGDFSHTVENNVLSKYDYLDPKDKAFLKRLTDGCVEEKLILDQVIDRYASCPARKQKKLIRNVLRIGIYQILFMDRVPDHSAVDESVRIVKNRGMKNLAGFVNGTLRSVSNNREEILSGLNREEAFPLWIREHLIRHYGKDRTKIILRELGKPHPVCLRDRAFFTDEGRGEDFPREFLAKSDVLPFARILKPGYSVWDIPGFAEGRYTVQDLSSQLAVTCAGIRKGDRVLDVCASPGGKSVHACDLGAEVTARDLSESKIGKILENTGRCRIEDLKTEVFDAAVFDPSWEDQADVVLADLPCSGLGVMGKKADIRHRVKPEDLTSLRDLQRKILDTVRRYVKPGGILLYSTCTMNPEENEDQVRYVTEHYPFVLSPLPGYLDTGMRQLLPGIDPGDGFFIARLVRTDEP